MRFNLKVSEIKAGLLICSKDETRFILCGLHIELRPKQQPIVIATDGRRMVIINSEAPQDEDVQRKEAFTLSMFVLEEILKICGRYEFVTFEVNKDEKILTAHIILAGTSIKFNKDGIIDGSYPKWRQVIPKDTATSIKEIGFNALWAADFSKAAKLLGSDSASIKIRVTDENGAFMVKSEKAKNFLGVLMPCRISIEQWNPLWIGVDTETPAPVEQAA